MVYCIKCGQQSPDGTVVCPKCGAAVPGGNRKQEMHYGQSELFDPTDVASNKWMAILSYLGFLVFVPILAGRGSRFARYHANQGLVLFCAGVIFNVIRKILRFTSSWIFFGNSFLDLYGLLGIVSLFFFIVAIIGIVNAAKGEAKQLPLIGKIRLIRW